MYILLRIIVNQLALITSLYFLTHFEFNLKWGKLSENESEMNGSKNSVLT